MRRSLVQIFLFSTPFLTIFNPPSPLIFGNMSLFRKIYSFLSTQSGLQTASAVVMAATGVGTMLQHWHQNRRKVQHQAALKERIGRLEQAKSRSFWLVFGLALAAGVGFRIQAIVGGIAANNSVGDCS